MLFSLVTGILFACRLPDWVGTGGDCLFVPVIPLLQDTLRDLCKRNQLVVQVSRFGFWPNFDLLVCPMSYI